LSLQEAGISDLQFKAVFSTGEIVTPMHKKVIEDVFQAPLLDSYGHMERTVSVSQCLAGGYHVHSDYGVLEIEKQDQIKNGDRHWGKVIGTSLHNFAMPLIRYDTGDRIEEFPKKEICSCGRTLPLISAIHGREEDTLVTPDGRYLTTLFIIPEFVTGLDHIQFVQVSKHHLEIRIVPNQKWNENESTKLYEFTTRMTGDSLNIKILEVKLQDLIVARSGKIRAVVGLSSANPPVV
jgi:phenylacetate-CoA ligase